MSRTIVIGDGPAGLSAALFLGKNDHETLVYAQDATLMHKAQLHNYLGIDSILGTDFQILARDQVEEVGVAFLEAEVESVTAVSGRFEVQAAGQTETADYVVLAGGKASTKLADSLGAQQRDGAIVVDADGRTTVDGLYAAGHAVRPNRSQAIISAGAGAIVALDILSRESGSDVHDWDTPPKE